MKHQIARLSPHQNAKVFAVLMAVASLVIVIPMSLIFYAAGPGKAGGMSLLPIVLAPIFYLIGGYVVTVLWCALYNALFKVVGGIEFESVDGVN
jgi:hypothetical protein